MERAIFITNPGQLKYVTSNYTRLYFGQEFCERLIPSLKDLMQVADFARKKRLNFSLVTPYVTDEGIERLKALFAYLNFSLMKSEVVANDWGAVNLINNNYHNLTLVLGRLLTKQKRSPQLIKLLQRKFQVKFAKNPQDPKIKYLVLQKKFPLNVVPYYKGSNVSSVQAIHDFLISRRINRIELDNIGQGIRLDLPKDKIAASLYFPYVYITTTFFCLTAGCEHPGSSFLKIKPCNKECQKYYFKLHHKSMRKEILLKGNTQFYKNSRCRLAIWEKMGINRLVYVPEIPV